MRQSLSYKHAGLTGSTFGQKRHRFSWSVGLAGVLTALFCLVLVWPFIFGAGWQELLHPALSSDDWQAVAVSVLCASADAALMIVLATPLAWILARRQFRGKFFLEGLALVPLLTPPLALGMLLANVLGPQSTIGQIARHFDITLTNSIPALIIAGFYAAAPFYVFGAKLAFQAVSPGYEEMAGLLGKSRMAAWFTVTLPLALGGLFWALLIGWLRALGEFGVAIIIAYFPHGIPIQMWVNLQDIGPQAVYPLLWMLILVAMPVPLLLSLQVERGWGGWFNVLGKLSGLLDRLAPVRSGACPATAAGKRAEHHNPIHINILISSPVALKADFCLRGITAITGPTGSGKTTLLRAIAGVIPCKMTTATHTALASRRMGYAPQQPLLFPHLTVLRNVAFGLNGPDRQSRARLILEKLGLEHLDEKMPAALSAGQAQLVCVARALACEPDLLLLDEPTAALDFGTSDAFMYMLREMTRTANITILLATHDRDIARASDAWLSIVNGELIWSSPISQSEIQVPLVY